MAYGLTSTEEEMVRANWKHLPRVEIANLLGKSLSAVTGYAYRHGLSRRSPALTYETLTDLEKAYIAGIVDGEGHIEIGLNVETRKPHTRYAISVVVTNTDYGLLDWLQRRLPGSYIREKHYAAPKAHWKPAWSLRLHRRGSVKSLLQELLPYLIVKRDRALAALHAIDSIKSRQWR